MDASEFRRAGKEMIDFAADYLESIRDRKPLADVQPGYLHQLIPAQAPQEPETWSDVMGDIERVIMPGVGPRVIQLLRCYFNNGVCFFFLCVLKVTLLTQ